MTIINNSKTDPNKILPMQYLWARQHYKDGVANNWVPEEIPMQDDVEMWKSNKLSESERKMILWNLGFFSTAEAAVVRIPTAGAAARAPIMKSRLFMVAIMKFLVLAVLFVPG